MRLIDVDALIAYIKKRIRNEMVIAWLCRIIGEVPTIDAVSVVRCKDCEYFRTNDENVLYCFNPFGLDDPKPNGFCNYRIQKN